MNQDDDSDGGKGMSLSRHHPNSDRFFDRSARAGLNKTDMTANVSRTMMDISQMSSSNLEKKQSAIQDDKDDQVFS